jgi:hypothetical protein
VSCLGKHSPLDLSQGNGDCKIICVNGIFIFPPN